MRKILMIGFGVLCSFFFVGQVAVAQTCVPYTTCPKGKIPMGPPGPMGPAGPAGPMGLAGPAASCPSTCDGSAGVVFVVLNVSGECTNQYAPSMGATTPGTDRACAPLSGSISQPPCEPGDIRLTTAVLNVETGSQETNVVGSTELHRNPGITEFEPATLRVITVCADTSSLP